MANEGILAALYTMLVSNNEFVKLNYLFEMNSLRDKLLMLRSDIDFVV